MSKGKYTKSRKEDEEEILHRFSKALQEEDTAPLPDLETSIEEEEAPIPRDSAEQDPQQPISPFSDLDHFEEISIPELTSLDTQSEDSEYSAIFNPIPERYSASQEEKNQKAAETASAHSEETKSSPQRSSFLSKNKKAVFLCLISVFLLCSLAAGGLAVYRYAADPYDHRILNGVYVAGINLGNMTKKEAEAAVKVSAASMFESDMVITLPDQIMTLPSEAASVSLNCKAAVNAAYDYGRTGSRQEKEQAFRDSTTKEYHVDIRPFLNADENYIRSMLQGYADSNGSDFTPSSFALEGERPPLEIPDFNEKNTPQTLLLIIGNPGFYLDVQQALDDVMEAYSLLDFSPALELNHGEAIPEPLDIDLIYDEYHIDSVDSSIDQETFQIISGRYGYTFDRESAKKELDKAHYGDTVRISMEYIEPEITDDRVYFMDVLSSAETPHGDNKNRNVNLDLACKALDGLVLNPGDEFSYNETLGQRTAEKGYKGAPAYSGNELVNSIGGGICQVSSTLYYACLMADLEITDRINHGFLPTYIDPGMDATVSWGKPDYKFKNNMDFPIQIKAETTEDKVKIKILGTDNRDYYVKLDYTNSIIDPEEYVKEFSPDSGYEDGEVVESGVPGHYVKTFRYAYSKETDELISETQIATSVYTRLPRVIASVPEPETTAPPQTEAPDTAPSEEPTPTPPPQPEPPAPDNGGEEDNAEKIPDSPPPSETQAPETNPPTSEATDPPVEDPTEDTPNSTPDSSGTELSLP